MYLFDDLCKIFGNTVSDASVISAQDQLQLMEANDIAIEIDMDGTCGDLVVIGNVDISNQDTDRPSEINMVGISGNMDVTSKDEISNQDTERPREMDMFGNLVVTGGSAQISSQDEKRPNKRDTNARCGNLVMSGNAKTAPHVRKRTSAMPSDSRPAKKELRMKEALSEMASAVKALMNKREKNNNKSFENALSALQAMPDIDEELVMDACDLLEDERKAKIFLALDVSLRKKWLLRKLRR